MIIFSNTIKDYIIPVLLFLLMDTWLIAAPMSLDMPRQPRMEKVDAPNALTGNAHADIELLIPLLSAIKKTLGRVDQPSSCDTILAILGDADRYLGPDQNMSRKLKEIYDAVSNFDITATIDFSQLFTVIGALQNEMGDQFENTWTVLGQLDDTLCDKFETTWTVVAGCEEAITDGISEVLTAINATQNEIGRAFIETWTNLDELQACDPTPLFGPIVIDEPGSYCLANSFTFPFGIGIEIVADNVMLDLNANIITTISGTCISITGTNVMVANGSLEQGNLGISIANSNFVNIRDIQLYNQSQIGLQAVSSTNIFFKNCSVDFSNSLLPSANGIVIGAAGVGCRQVMLNDCYVTQCRFGCLINNSVSVSLHGCCLEDNNSNGVVIGEMSSDIRLRDCLVRNNFNGIVLQLATNISLEQCAIFANRGTGCFIESGNRMQLTGCNMSFNQGSGALVTADRVVIEGCLAQGNGSFGYELNGTQMNIQKTRALQNNNNGFFVSSVSQMLLKENSADDNGQSGFSFSANSEGVQVIANSAVGNNFRGFDNAGMNNNFVANFATNNSNANYNGVVSVAPVAAPGSSAWDNVLI